MKCFHISERLLGQNHSESDDIATALLTLSECKLCFVLKAACIACQGYWYRVMQPRDEQTGWTVGNKVLWGKARKIEAAQRQRKTEQNGTAQTAQNGQKKVLINRFK
jgi:hypothetical protein